MDCIVTVSRVEFLEINQMFESELKLYFPLNDDECYTLIPGSKKELCKRFRLAYNDSDDCNFEDLVGKKIKVSKGEGACTFVDYEAV